MNKPTPSPWHYIEMPDGGYLVVVTYDQPIAKVHAREPDAALIAAAPMMLDALELIATAKDRGFTLNYAVACAETALERVKNGYYKENR